MSRPVEGHLVARGMKFALVASRFNETVVDRLLSGAMDSLLRHGAANEDLSVFRVPGAFEIPQVARTLAASGKYSGVVCLGALIRGETAHFEVIASAVVRGISQAAEETGVPVTLGVLTTDTMQQAEERSGGKSGNKGREAAVAAIEMASLRSRLLD